LPNQSCAYLPSYPAAVTPPGKCIQEQAFANPPLSDISEGVEGDK